MTQWNGLNGEKPLVSATIGEIIGPSSYCPFQLIKSHNRANAHSDYTLSLKNFELQILIILGGNFTFCVNFNHFMRLNINNLSSLLRILFFKNKNTQM